MILWKNARMLMLMDVDYKPSILGYLHEWTPPYTYMRVCVYIYMYVHISMISTYLYRTIYSSGVTGLAPFFQSSIEAMVKPSKTGWSSKSVFLGIEDRKVRPGSIEKCYLSVFVPQIAIQQCRYSLLHRYGAN